MKTLKQTLKTSSYLLIALMLAFSTSCSPEDGKDGEDGAQGEQGIEGLDGNANVKNITFDASMFSGSFDVVSISQLTQEVLENDAILVYLKAGTAWFPVPCAANSYQFNHAVEINFFPGEVDFDYSDAQGVSVSINAGDLDSGRIIIIESTSNSTASRLSETTDIYFRLENAGVDITNYYAVCDYFGIDY